VTPRAETVSQTPTKWTLMLWERREKVDLYSAGVPVMMSTAQSPSLAAACAEAGVA
jgi:hypothetical protein